MTLIEAVREAIGAAIDSALLPDAVYATYTGTGLKTDSGPDEIPIEQVDMPPLYTEEGLIVSCRVSEGTESGESGASGESAEVSAGGEGVTLTLKCALSAGDRVIALTHHDRQRFTVLYRI